LFGRLGFAITLATFGTLAGGEEWDSIATMLGWSMWGGLAGFVLLFITSRYMNRP